MRQSLLPFFIAMLFAAGLLEARAQNFYLYDPPATLESRVVEPTAEAWAMRRYQDYPVCYATGTATVEVPLLSWNCGDASVAIGLSYHTGGIKAEEDAGNTGLGWSLTGLGRISRRVVGLPDERRESYFSLPVIIDSISETVLTTDLARDLLSQSADACRDIYSYDIPGHSGSFLIDDLDNVTQLPQTELKIGFKREPYDSDADFPRNRYEINRFTITTPEGMVYVFRDKERVSFKANHDPVPVPMIDTDYECTVTWNLSEIITPGETEKITISYGTAGKWQRGHTRKQPTRTAIWSGTSPQTPPSTSPVRSTIGPVTHFLNPLVPQKIQSRTATVTFTWRQDPSPNPTAPHICITGMSLRNSNGDIVRDVALGYSNSIDGRKLLYRVTVSASDTILDQRTFTYQASVNQPMGDSFGFPNGRSRDDNFYESVLDINGNPADARSTDISHISDNSLLSVTDAMGCTTRFTYEPKTASSTFNGRSISATIGQRVASITSRDAVTGRQRIRKFTYSNPRFTIDLARIGNEAWISLSGLKRNASQGGLLAYMMQSTLTATMTTSSRLPGMPYEAADIVYGTVMENVSGTGITRPIRTSYEFDLSQAVHEIVGAGRGPAGNTSSSPNEISDYLGCHTMIPAGVDNNMFSRVFSPKAVTYFARQRYGGGPLLRKRTVFEWRDGAYRPYETEERTYRIENNRIVPLGLHCELLKYRRMSNLIETDPRVTDPQSDVNAFIYSARCVAVFCDTIRNTRHYPDGNSRTITTAMESESDRWKSLPVIPVLDGNMNMRPTKLVEFPGDSIHLLRHIVPHVVSTTTSCAGDRITHIRALAENVFNERFNALSGIGYQKLPIRERWIFGSGDTIESACEYGIFHGAARLTRKYISKGNRPPMQQITFDGYNVNGMPTGGYTADGAHVQWKWDNADCLTKKTVAGRLTTTYTHKPLVGCTSIIYPSGKKRYFSYAGGRLMSESNATTVLKRHSYSLYCTDRANCVETSTLVGADMFRTERAYYDSFGMPVRQVQLDASGTRGTHLLSATEYDAIDRPLRQTLPVTTSDAGFSDTLTFDDILDDTQAEYDDLRPLSSFTYPERADAAPAAAYIPGEANTDAPTLTQRLCNNISSPILRCWRFSISNNMLVRNGYHPTGSLDVSQIKDPDGRVVLTFSDWRGRKLLERVVASGSELLDTYYVYDRIGRLEAVLMPAAVPQTTQTYGQEPFDLSYNLKSNAFRNIYDANGHLAEKREPECAPVSYRYDVFGRMAFSQNADELAENKCRAYFYDNAGRQVLTVICKDSFMPEKGCLAPSMHASFNYSKPGIGGSGYIASNISRMSGDLVSANYYDLYLQHKRDNYSIFPDSRSLASETAYGLLTGTIEAIYHHELSTPSDNTDRRALLTYFVYDDEERQIYMAESSIKKDEYAVTITPRNPAGLPTFVSNVLYGSAYTYGMSTTFSYDFLGRPLRVRGSHGPVTNMLLSTKRYNKHGLLTSDTKPGAVRSLKYDINSRLTSVYESPFSETIEYTPGGLVSSRTENGIGGLSERHYSYDGASRLSQVTIETFDPSRPASPATPDVEASFTYDRNSNIKTLTRTGMVSNGSPTQVRATVDDLTLTYSGNHLVRVTDSAPAFTAYGSYDFIDGADETLEYTYDALGRLTSDLNRGITSIEWNPASQPHRITLDNGTWIRYSFSASGRKLLDEAGITVMPSTESALSPSALSDGAPSGFGSLMWGNHVTQSRRYTGPFELKGDTLVRINAAGGYWESGLWHSYVTDRQGNIRAVIRGNGTVAQRTDYYPYGLPCASTSPTANAYKFGGKEMETRYALNFTHHGARLYFPDLGRFASPDPLAGLTPTTSTYLYCGANPVNRIDPTGLYSEWVERTLGGLKAVGGVLEASLGASLSSTGAGAVIGVPMMIHGADQTQAGIIQTFTGEPESTLTSKGLQALGLDQTVADFADDAISLAFGGGALIKSAKVAIPAVAKASSTTSSATSNPVEKLESILIQEAQNAAKAIPGKGHVRGTKVHTEFRKSVEGIGIDGYYVRTEVNYKLGQEFRNTVKGGCRIDAAIYDANNNIVKIFDLKTGSAELTQRQINHIHINVNPFIPIQEIKVK